MNAVFQNAPDPVEELLAKADALRTEAARMFRRGSIGAGRRLIAEAEGYEIRAHRLEREREYA